MTRGVTKTAFERLEYRCHWWIPPRRLPIHPVPLVENQSFFKRRLFPHDAGHRSA
jgi:hypothetical protein